MSAGCRAAPPYTSTFSAAMNASCGISTLPYLRIFFLSLFYLTGSLRLRVASQSTRSLA